MKATLICILFLSGVAFSLAQTPSGKSSQLVERANAVLNSLDVKLKKKAQYPLTDDERLNWHFVPRSRNGISFHDLSDKQRESALALLRASLSDQGYKKTTDIIALENILRDLEGRGANDSYRDPLNYYFTFFGTPAANQLWGWRLEGHHVAFNFLSNGEIIESSTPSFLGSNPGIVPRGEQKGKQVLKAETDLGFALVNSLSEQQRKLAVFSDDALPEILSFNKVKAEPLAPEGIKYNALDTRQQSLFLELLDVYVKNYQLGFSNKLMTKIKAAGFDNLSFAWAGSLKPGAGHYYRIQGPMLLIEYDNTQNNANHVHTVVRDLTNDFGEDILREHYKRDHQR